MADSLSTQPSENLIHPMQTDSKSATGGNQGLSLQKALLVLVLAILLGSLSGFGLTSFASLSKGTPKTGAPTVSTEKAKEVAGIVDKKTFKDKAEGILKEGGIDGEGNYHLERPGGESQNVYLTSSTVDLEQYLNKKVRVWGDTQTAQKAGWLMDVGLVEVL